MYRLRSIFLWLRRCGYSRGFGVQSPSVYSFIRYVINEHYPYYAYDDLKAKFSQVDPLSRKLSELYFRVANYSQAKTWLDFIGNEVYRSYIQCGCNHTDVSVCKIQITDFDVALIKLDELSIDTVNCLINNAASTSIILIEGIFDNSANKRMWLNLLENKKISVSFDLYHVGILFFDDRFKHNYIVNF